MPGSHPCPGSWLDMAALHLICFSGALQHGRTGDRAPHGIICFEGNDCIEGEIMYWKRVFGITFVLQASLYPPASALTERKKTTSNSTRAWPPPSKLTARWWNMTFL